VNTLFPRRIAAVSTLALALGGCAVHLDPFSTQSLTEAAQHNIAHVAINQEALTRPIDLYEAMARALKYNLDYQVETMQTAVRSAELNLSTYDGLPNFVASAGYAARDSYDASSGFNLTTNSSSTSYSTSQDITKRTADLSFSWNILDFGLSYVRARQAADKVMIGREMQRKAVHRLLEDVRTAYWRAVTFERLVSRLNALSARTEAALSNSKALADGRETSLVTALTYERELTEIKRAAIDMQRDLVVAKAQLAALMNLTPGMKFSLVLNSYGTLPRMLPNSMDAMMEIAVRDREELHENLYQQRINSQEVKAAMLEMLPGLQLTAGPNWDSNSYLMNSNWVTWGAKSSFNLLRVFQLPAKRDLIEDQQDLLKSRALALTMAVMTQVHVSRIRYLHAQQEMRVADDYRSVQRRLVAQIRIEAAANRVSEQTLLREELNTLVAEAKFDLAHADVESAYANIFASIGWDPYGAYQRDNGVRDIATALRTGWQKPTNGVLHVAVAK
jgi:outer membrane protein TolC